MQDITIPAMTLLGVLSTGSLIVWALAGKRLWNGQPALSPITSELPSVHWMPVILVLSWVGMQLMAVVAVPSSDGGKVPELKDVQGLCLFSLMLFLGLIIPLATQGQENRDGLGLHGNDLPHQAGLGGLGFFACVLPVMLAYAVTFPIRTNDNQHGLLQLLNQDGSGVTLIWIILAAVILAPLLEELMYRVVLQTWLQRIAPPREALIAVAVIFAAVHRLPDAIPLLPLALLLGYVYQQTRSFVAVVVMHMLFNATNLTLALM